MYDKSYKSYLYISYMYLLVKLNKICYFNSHILQYINHIYFYFYKIKKYIWLVKIHILLYI
jgi:hypothetical protein